MGWIRTRINPQAATVGEAPSVLDIARDLTSYQQQYHGTTEQGMRALECEIYQMPYPGQPLGGLMHTGIWVRDCSWVPHHIWPISYTRDMDLDVEMVQGCSRPPHPFPLPHQQSGHWVNGGGEGGTPPEHPVPRISYPSGCDPLPCFVIYLQQRWGRLGGWYGSTWIYFESLQVCGQNTSINSSSTRQWKKPRTPHTIGWLCQLSRWSFTTGLLSRKAPGRRCFWFKGEAAETSGVLVLLRFYEWP